MRNTCALFMIALIQLGVHSQVATIECHGKKIYESGAKMVKEYDETCTVKAGDANFNFKLTDDKKNPLIVVVNAHNFDNYDWTPDSGLADLNDFHDYLIEVKDKIGSEKKKYQGWSHCQACKDGKKCLYDFQEYKQRSHVLPFNLFEQRRNVYFLICNGQFFDMSDKAALTQHGKKRVSHLEIKILGQAVWAIPFIVIKNQSGYPIYHLLANTSEGKVLPMYSALCNAYPSQYAMGRLNPFNKEEGRMRENSNHKNVRFMNEVRNFSSMTCEQTEYNNYHNIQYYPFIMFTGYSDWQNSYWRDFEPEENELLI